MKFVITDDFFLEMLLVRIRGGTIKFASKLNKERKAKDAAIIAEIESMESNKPLEQTDPYAKLRIEIVSQKRKI